MYVAAVSIYPEDDCCSNSNCNNLGPLKKEYRKKAVVYTQGAGVQPAWNTSLYCQSRSCFGARLVLNGFIFRVSDELSQELPRL
jgi:CxC5 like cysteine cluster associated with KDZ transposases